MPYFRDKDRFYTADDVFLRLKFFTASFISQRYQFITMYCISNTNIFKFENCLNRQKYLRIIKVSLKNVMISYTASQFHFSLSSMFMIGEIFYLIIERRST